MAIDFVTAVCGGAGQLAPAFLSVDMALHQFGARRKEVYQEDLEGTSPNPEDLQSTGLGGTSVAADELNSWTGVSALYRTDTFQFELLMSRPREEELNAFVRVDVRELRRLSGAGNLEAHDDVLVTIAEALRSPGGLGRVELDLDPVPTAQLASLIFESERLGAAPPSLALLSATSFDYTDVVRRSGQRYSVRRVRTFYVMKAEDYPEPAL
jgi:hypothetical protein